MADLQQREVRPAVSVRGLQKRYGDIVAVRGISFEVAPGETFGFLGPNGAGKSTTISMLCTLVEPTGGRATGGGLGVGRRRAGGRRPHRPGVPGTTLAGHPPPREGPRFH